MLKKSALGILSGGLDSTTALYLSHSTHNILQTITFDYGQKSAIREIAAAKEISKSLQIYHHVFPLPWLESLTKTALVNPKQTIPNPSSMDLDQLDISTENAKKVWVPNRNGLFLNIAASIAEALDIETLITGFNAEEAATFPDNSEEFLNATNQFFSYSTLKKIVVESPTIRMTKNEIVTCAASLKVPFSKLWFCYEGHEAPCRQCESCQRNFRAFRQVGIADPFKPS